MRFVLTLLTLYDVNATPPFAQSVLALATGRAERSWAMRSIALAVRAHYDTQALRNQIKKSERSPFHISHPPLLKSPSETRLWAPLSAFFRPLDKKVGEKFGGTNKKP